MKRSLLLVPIALGATLPSSLRAQLGAQLDLGIRGAPVAALGTRSLWSVAPALRYDESRLRLRAEGDYRDYGRLGRGVSGALGASYFVPLTGPVNLEVTGSMRGQDGGPLARAGLWDAGGRLHITGLRDGAWLGSQAGQDGNGRTLRWEAAAWRRLGNLTLQFQGSQLALAGPARGSTVTPDTLNPDTLAGNRSQVQTDVGAWLHWAGTRLQLSMALGRRYGVTEVAAVLGTPAGGLGDGRNSSTARRTTWTWWSADGTYWVAPRWGVTASVGQRPPDSQLRSPGGRFVQLALRASLNGGPREAPAPPNRVGGRRDLHVRRLDGELVELQLLAPEASRVEMRGDFTDWRAVDLERVSGGRWRAKLQIAPGLHSVTVRFDGGAWEPPPGTRIEVDEFEQSTGVLVIE